MSSEEYNIKYIFEELDEKDLQDIQGKRYVVFPVAGPALLEMKLSKRQLEELRRKIALVDDSKDEIIINLIGRTRKDGESSKKTCTCDISVLMCSGCKCGSK